MPRLARMKPMMLKLQSAGESLSHRRFACSWQCFPYGRRPRPAAFPACTAGPPPTPPAADALRIL